MLPDYSNLTLVIPEKEDVERDRVAEVWTEGRGRVERLGRFWAPPPIPAEEARIYGPDSFALVVAQMLGVELMSPADDLLARAPSRLLRRNLRMQTLLCTLADAGEFPAFIKPVTPKIFRSGIYQTADALAAECTGLAGETLVFISEIVELEAEARFFVLDAGLAAGALYEGAGDLQDGARLAAEVAFALPVPRTCVIDVAKIRNRGWALLELNASWGSGLNGCDPAGAARCIAAATHVSR